ncbi:YheC/YheD family protein [Paenibacillus abyssi]|uniref:Endospore coat-associated protein n=1 Tax=Paenibacillus abyssi TaxID=1340531 RepID=A0A917G7H1_9BACL|nr:YheC/YheD family protein [Paenibacillus abyssi]GGG26686.1 hypothetical protein GCM10010916_48870 [Paenibacillus abyssi]
MAIQRVTSKWEKTNALLKNDVLREYIPPTNRLTEDHLYAMLEQYNMVYVKPNKGTFGTGVLRIEKIPEGYQLQLGTALHHFASYADLFDKLRQLTHDRPYLIQRGIELLKHQSRRFDLRVMVQQSPRRQWETTGIIGRLAHPRKIVTNYHSGGTPMSFEKLMTDHLSEAEQHRYLTMLKKLGVDIARQLQTAYPNLKELGVDIAVDTEFKPWILEVNTMPDPYIFCKLRDKSTFRKVYRYALAYGRFKRKIAASSSKRVPDKKEPYPHGGKQNRLK